MRRIVKIKIVVGILVALLVGLLILIDIISLNKNTVDYINVYQISEDAPHWMFKSVNCYVGWSLLKIGIIITYMIFSILALIKKQKRLIKGLLIFELIVLIWVIRYLYLFYASGFDHYPGFDPYIF
jgi:hypothetical protein